jgi:hypothetical protein
MQGTSHHRDKEIKVPMCGYGLNFVHQSFFVTPSRISLFFTVQYNFMKNLGTNKFLTDIICINLKYS